MEHKETQFITGLRAYAALGVFVIHSSGFGLKGINIYLDRIIDFGKYGLIVFFVLSAFTISMSIDSSNEFRPLDYIIKRICRVAPMYYVAIVAAFFLGGIPYYMDLFHVENNVMGLLLHLSFFNWLDFRYQNNLIGVEWTVPIEFVYYLAIPVFLSILKKKTDFPIIALVIAAVVSSTAYLLYKDPEFAVISYQWSPLKYLFTFIVGICAYLFFSSTKNYLPSLAYPDVILFTLIVGVVANVAFGFVYTDPSGTAKTAYSDIFASIVTAAFILLLKQKSTLKNWLFENPFVLFFGKISYSFYLLHMIVIQHMRPNVPLLKNHFILFGVVFGLSTVCYYVVERPFIHLGKKISLVKKAAIA
jgi:peptidoglycan/LPS O-acetylase OafA/YrhL